MGRYLLAAALVRLADEGARVALVLLGLQRTGDPFVSGLLVACLMLPHVLTAPVVGWALDRSKRARWILASAAGTFGVSLVITAACLGRIALPVVLAILLVGGCAGPALTGGLTSQLALLVRTERLPRAYGLDSMVYNVAGIAGPALAGIIAALAGGGAATIALACVALAGGLVLAFLPTRERPKRVHLPITSGLRVLLTRPVLLTVTLGSSFAQLGLGALAITTAVLATSAGTPAATGSMLACFATGGLIGSLWWTWRPSSVARAPWIAMIALAGVGVPLGAAALTTSSLVITSGLYLLSGCLLGPATGALFTTRHSEATPTTESQVFTLSGGLKITFAALGALLGGVIAVLPPEAQLLIIAGCVVVAGIGGAAGLWSRSLQDTHQRHARVPRDAAR